MIEKTLKRVCTILLAAIMLIAAISGCTGQASRNDYIVFTSFRDVPGVTAEQISAVEQLQGRIEYFVYSVNHSTEAFISEDGTIQGFAALFCEWLTDLFEIPFHTHLAEWDDLIDGLDDGTIDFTGELTANEDRRKKYIMTDDIIQRRIVYIRLSNSTPLQEIAQIRPLRFAFLDGTTTVDDIRRHESNEFEEILVDDYSEVFEMLESGEIDAFFDESPAEAAFDTYGEVVVNTYFPIIYSPVSLTTQNPEFGVIIDIVQMALDNGAITHLTSLANQGHRDYMAHKLFMLLTSEERNYIRNNPIIPFAAEVVNYPVSFYDARTDRWEGIAHDVLHEIERFTGLTFERQNNEDSNFPELLDMLESGQAAFITELVQTEERRGNFLWAEEAFFPDHLVLISKTEFRDLEINEILYIRTGLARNTAHSTLFHMWFPNHKFIYEYESSLEAFDALERGEIDVVMASEHQLLIMTNYRELVGYKANFIFDYYFQSTFGFNKDREILASIITKAMRQIDVEVISGRWLRKTYDYRIRLAQERTYLVIGLGALSLGLVVLGVLAIKKRKERRLLEVLVDSRTKELFENQEQLVEAVATAENANRAKSEFLANMSHEIRTPMNAVIGMSEILVHEKLNPRQMEYVQDIILSSKSLVGIINDILDMSKIEAGKLELNEVDYNFNQFIDNIISMFTHVAENKDLKFLTEISDDIPNYLFGDDLRLRQALTNICGNAVKFTEKGYIKLSVVVRDEKLMFFIEDTGPGIITEDIPKLFKAFEQVDTTRNRGIVGTGLGLPICKSFIEMMGGEIVVESVYGQGTTFSIILPLVIGNPENIQGYDYSDSELSFRAPDARILVTDDNEFNLKVASGLLQILDIKAETADSGLKAIELVKQNEYDIVFMDHMMPEMDGIETTHAIRELGAKYEDLTIIALTANAVKGAREMFFSNSFNDFLAKPIDSNDLRMILNKHLPKEKIITEISTNVKQDSSGKEQALLNRIAVTFVKENQNTSFKIVDALRSGDIKTAHRLAHTLKSSSGYLGRKILQEAAASLELSLKKEPPEYSSEQLNLIEVELGKVLRDYEPLLIDSEESKPEAGQISNEEQKALFAELRPLLERADFSASNYIEKLQSIAGMEELAARIEDYDFESALEVLKSLETR